MKLFNKKTTAGLLAGAMLLTGSISTGIVQAADNGSSGASERTNQQRRHMQPPQMNTEKMAQEIADTFGVSKDEVESWQKENKNDFRDVFHAALLAKTSGKSFADVAGMKTSQNSWKDVASALGISQEQIKNAQEDLMVTRIEKNTGLAQNTSKALLKDGYQPRDITAAAMLAKESGKNVQDILSMRKLNNSWKDVAKALNISEETLQKDMNNTHENGMPGDMHRGAPPQMNGDSNGQPPCPPSDDNGSMQGPPPGEGPDGDHQAPPQGERPDGDHQGPPQGTDTQQAPADAE